MAYKTAFISIFSLVEQKDPSLVWSEAPDGERSIAVNPLSILVYIQLKSI